MKKLFSIVALALVLVLAGCNQSQVVSNLQLIVDAAEAAFPLVAQQSGLDPALTTQISGYLVAVNSAVGQAAPILSTPGSAALKSAQVAEIFAKVAAPNLPAGTPQAAVSAVQSVAAAVGQFLSSTATPKALKKTAKPVVVAPTSGDVSRLAKIGKRAEKNVAILKK